MESLKFNYCILFLDSCTITAQVINQIIFLIISMRVVGCCDSFASNTMKQLDHFQHALCFKIFRKQSGTIQLKAKNNDYSTLCNELKYQLQVQLTWKQIHAREKLDAFMFFRCSQTGMFLTCTGAVAVVINVVNNELFVANCLRRRL